MKLFISCLIANKYYPTIFVTITHLRGNIEINLKMRPYGFLSRERSKSELSAYTLPKAQPESTVTFIQILSKSNKGKPPKKDLLLLKKRYLKNYDL
jgi:hypothetical protein